MRLFSTVLLVLMSIFSLSCQFLGCPDAKMVPIDTQSEEVVFRTELSVEPDSIQELPEAQNMKPVEVITKSVIQESRTAEETETVPVETDPPVADAQPEIVYEDVYETVYATTAVNIRTGPGVEFSVLETALYGSSITRTGIGSNGWSRVIYNGDIAYMASEYLSTDNPVSSGPLGTAGRLTIPSVGIDVALYACSSSGEYAAEQQRIVDDIDSAAYIDQVYTNGHIIADHNHQGFDAIKSCIPYETYAYINFGSYIQRYVCTGIGSGQNLGNNLIDWNGRSLNYDPIPGGLAMYTCNENSTNVTITYWEAA